MAQRLAAHFENQVTENVRINFPFYFLHKID